MSTPTRMTIYRLGDALGPEWQAFLVAMRSGSPVEIDEAMFYYWLECLPPVYYGRRVQLPDGSFVTTSFGFAEGAEPIVAFWCKGSRYFCCRTTEVNRGS